MLNRRQGFGRRRSDPGRYQFHTTAEIRHEPFLIPAESGQTVVTKMLNSRLRRQLSGSTSADACLGQWRLPPGT